MSPAGSPPTSIPWWMASAIVAGWLSAVAGVVILARQRRRRVRARRPEVLPAASDRDFDDGLPERAGGPLELGPGP